MSPRSKGTILNVEDYAATRQATSEILRSAGYDVAEAATGGQALELIDQIHPQLVLLDVELPDMSGYDVCRQLKSNDATSQIPVLQVSGTYSRGKDRAAGLNSGADGYLVKPAEAEELLATIRALLRVRQAEEARKESEARYELLFEGNSLPTWVFELESLAILAVNEAAIRHYGYSREEFLAMSMKDIGPPEAVPTLMEYVSQIPHTAFNGAQWDHRKKDGTIINAEVVWHELMFKGRHALLVLAKDVTEEKRVESALRESEEHFHIIADTAPVMLWISENDNSCTFFNRAWLDFTGRSMEEEKGNGWFIGVHPDDQNKCLTTYMRAFDAREPYTVEYRLRRKEGDYRWVLANGVPRFSQNGVFSGYIGSCLDITERKRAEEEREEILQREREARDMAEAATRAKDEFLAVVSHELRTPLNSIFGWARMLRGHQPDGETLQRALEIIERSAEAQNRLIEDLLDVSRIRSGKLSLDVRPLELIPLIEAACEILRPAAEAKRIELRLRLDSDAGTIAGDSDRLQQVFWNVLSNAIKFTPPDGRVELRLEPVDSGVRITVTDTGRGISPGFLPFVFDSFRQADGSGTRRHGGLGLGLALVRRVVELHGGTVEAQSRGQNLGATFTVYLPTAPSSDLPSESWERAPRPEAAKPAMAAILDGLRVLVVDDEPDARDVLALILKQSGAAVMTACSVAEAMSILASDSPSGPDVLVSDIGMPEADGYALIRQVRQLEPERGGLLPAIAVTAYNRASDRLRALSAGFQMHLPKPVEPEELVTVVASLSGRLAKDRSQNNPAALRDHPNSAKRGKTKDRPQRESQFN
jgi:PAS domain S-box-containing protein